MRKNMKAVALATGVVVLGGGGVATAQSLITGAGIKNSSLTGADVKNNSLTGKDLKDVRSGDVRDGSIRLRDLSPEVRQALANAGTAGAGGAPGLNGAPGATGAQGAAGANGANGAAGTNGTNGANGANGADAPEPVRIGASAASGTTFGEVRSAAGTESSTSAFVDDSLRFSTPQGRLVGRRLPIPAGTKLADLTSLTYVARSSTNTVGLPLKIVIDFNGAADGGFSTLVFEPENEARFIPGGQVNLANTWQLWHPLDSAWRSTRAINGQTAGFDYREWSAIVESNPEATVTGAFFEPGATGADGNWTGYIGHLDRASFDLAGADESRFDLGGK